MKKVYVTVNRWSDALECETIDISHAMTVFEEDNSPVETGLLAKDGTPICYVMERGPIGFIHHKEEE